jgi:hypothetical protein
MFDSKCLFRVITPTILDQGQKVIAFLPFALNFIGFLETRQQLGLQYVQKCVRHNGCGKLALVCYTTAISGAHMHLFPFVKYS